DMIYLLKNAPSLHWGRILEWLDGAVAASCVYLLLTYLARHGLVELSPEIRSHLFLRQRSFGRASLTVLHTLIDRYVTEGREFGMLVSERNFEILWNTLLLPRQPARRLPTALWNLMPSRVWLGRLLTSLRLRPFAKTSNKTEL